MGPDQPPAWRGRHRPGGDVAGRLDYSYLVRHWRLHIGPGEQAALQRFGNVCDTVIGPCDEDGGLVTATGLHWWWPGPIGNKQVVLVNEVRRMELGFRAEEGVEPAPVLDEGLMISGDLNIVDVRVVVQYDIQNLVDYLFPGRRPGESAGAEREVSAGRPDGRTLKTPRRPHLGWWWDKGP